MIWTSSRVRRAGVAGVVVASLAVAAAPAGAAEVVRGQLIVSFKAGTPSAKAQQLVERAGGRVRRRLGGIGALVVRPRRGTATGPLRAALRRGRLLRYAEPDYVLRKSETPNDPYYGSQYALGASSNGIAAPQAWTTKTSCALVATVDTGAQYQHPDLKANMYFNSGEVPSNGKDDDHNGYVDDYYGYNAEQGYGSGADADGHGTHVAGIIGGVGNNGQGVTGACWKAKIMPVRFMNAKGKGSTSDAIDAINYAVHMHAKVINCSFGSSSKSSALEDAVEHAQDSGDLLVVAAGNNSESIESDPEYPASYTEGNILTVAATTSTGALASFSNFGSKSVDLGAPGDNILSTYPTSTYHVLSGTSMATPLVSAAAAMLRSHDSSLTYSELRTILKETVIPDPALSGKTVTGGRLDLAGALAQSRR